MARRISSRHSTSAPSASTHDRLQFEQQNCKSQIERPHEYAVEQRRATTEPWSAPSQSPHSPQRSETIGCAVHVRGAERGEMAARADQVYAAVRAKKPSSIHPSRYVHVISYLAMFNDDGTVVLRLLHRSVNIKQHIPMH